MGLVSVPACGHGPGEDLTFLSESDPALTFEPAPARCQVAAPLRADDSAARYVMSKPTPAANARVASRLCSADQDSWIMHKPDFLAFLQKRLATNLQFASL